MASAIVIAWRRKVNNNNRLRRLAVNHIQRSFASQEEPTTKEDTNINDDDNDTTSNKRKNKGRGDGGYVLTNRQMRALNLVNRHEPSLVDPETSTTSTSSSKSNSNRKTDEITFINKTLASMKAEASIQEIDHAENNPMPWFSLLTHPSRALWRTSTKPPSAHVTETRFDVIQRSSRTNRQLRRTYDKVISNHRLLGERRERERRDLANTTNTNTTTNNDDKDTLSSPTKPHKKIRKDSLAYKQQNAANRAAKPVYYKPEYTLCALKYRLVPNYSITKRVLAETRSLLGGEAFRPRRVIDVGVGVGSASAAGLDYFGQAGGDGGGGDGGGDENGDLYRGVEWVHGVDPSQSMRDAAKIILESAVEANYTHDRTTNSGGGGVTKTRLTFGGALTASADPDSGMNTPLITTGTFDLALCTYTLLELPSAASALSIAAITWEKLRPNGVAIFIEPGTPDGFNALRSVRSMLLDCCPPFDTKQSDDEEGYSRMEGDEECHVIAPCSHNGKCPMQRHKTFFSNGDDELSDDDIFNSNDDGLDGDDEWDNEELNALGDDDIEEGDDDDEDFPFEKKKQFSSLLEPSATTNTTIKTKHKPAKTSTAVTDVHDSAFCSFVHHIPGGGGFGDQGEKFSYLVVQKRVTGQQRRRIPPLQMHNGGDGDGDGDDDLVESNDDPNPFHDTDIVDLLSKSLDAGRAAKIQLKKDRRKQRKIKKKNGETMTTTTKTHSSLLKQAIDVEDKFLDSDSDPLGLELVRGDDNRKSWGRIIRAPIKKKGHVILDYCGAPPGDNTNSDGDNTSGTNNNDGRIVRHRISRGESARAAPGMYGAARKARWGGLWPDVEGRLHVDDSDVCSSGLSSRSSSSGGGGRQK